MNGLFLQGGGAKGAFQAGAVYALNKKKIKFNVIAGTSIGAVNGYFVYTGNFEIMKDFYIKGGIEDKILKSSVDNVIPNDAAIEQLSKLNGINEDVNAFYVNYTSVVNGRLFEKQADVTKLNQAMALDCVRYSSLLPYVCPKGIQSMSYKDICKDFNSKQIFEKFDAKVKKGEYDNFNLDGGILNNNFMQPFLEHKADKIYIITLHNNFEIPKYLLEAYNSEDIIVIESDTQFKPEDTLNVESSFLKRLFFEGIKKAEDL